MAQVSRSLIERFERGGGGGGGGGERGLAKMQSKLHNFKTPF